MKRRIRLSRRTRLRAKNPERAARRHQVQYGGPEYRRFVFSYTYCATCDLLGSQLSHTAAGGMGMKAPWYTLILQCPACHREMHQLGFATFAASRGRSLDWLRDQARFYAEEYIRIFGAPPPGAPDLPERTANHDV